MENLEKYSYFLLPDVQVSKRKPLFPVIENLLPGSLQLKISSADHDRTIQKCVECYENVLKAIDAEKHWRPVLTLILSNELATLYPSLNTNLAAKLYEKMGSTVVEDENIPQNYWDVGVADPCRNYTRAYQCYVKINKIPKAFVCLQKAINAIIERQEYDKIKIIKMIAPVGCRWLYHQPLAILDIYLACKLLDIDVSDIVSIDYCSYSLFDGATSVGDFIQAIEGAKNMDDVCCVIGKCYRYMSNERLRLVKKVLSKLFNSTGDMVNSTDNNTINSTSAMFNSTGDKVEQTSNETDLHCLLSRKTQISLQWKSIEKILLENVGNTCAIFLPNTTFIFAENQQKIRDLGYVIYMPTISNASVKYGVCNTCCPSPYGDTVFVCNHCKK